MHTSLHSCGFHCILTHASFSNTQTSVLTMVSLGCHCEKCLPNTLSCSQGRLLWRWINWEGKAHTKDGKRQKLGSDSVKQKPRGDNKQIYLLEISEVVHFVARPWLWFIIRDSCAFESLITGFQAFSLRLGLLHWFLFSGFQRFGMRSYRVPLCATWSRLYQQYPASRPSVRLWSVYQNSVKSELYSHLELSLAH